MTELEALKERHSVRSYQEKPIDTDTLQKLRTYVDACNAEGNLHIQLIEDAGKTFNKLLNKFMGLGSAPSILACIGPDTADLDRKIGYYGQKIVLYAQMLGLNTCWAGTYNKKNVTAEIRDKERLAIVIAIGYGVNSGRPRKSKTADQVVRGGIQGKPDWFQQGVEAALLAPTAINQQKFEIVLKDDASVEILDKGGVLSEIDQGIVTYNFEVGANRHLK